MAKVGVLLVNLGTPASPRVGDVRRYLREFLSDPAVIPLHPIGRFLLLNLIILPFRPKKSAEAYRQIWMPEGSPLLVYGDALSSGLHQTLGEDFVVALGMRYGQPTIANAVARLAQEDIRRLLVVPLFPQYSDATTGSALKRTYDVLAKDLPSLPITVLPPYAAHPAFIRAQTALHRPVLKDKEPQHLVMSFHGLPESFIDVSRGHESACPRKGPCRAQDPMGTACYRAHCYATANAIRQEMDWPEAKFSVAFQSRLGRTPWTQPYFTEELERLAKAGIKRLAVSSPAFVADCVETLEELGIAAKEQWLELGGESFDLIPALNASPQWVNALAQMLQEQLSSSDRGIIAIGKDAGSSPCDAQS